MTQIPLTLQLDADGPFRPGVFVHLTLTVLPRGPAQVVFTLETLGRRIGDLAVDKADLVRIFGALGEHALERA